MPVTAIADIIDPEVLADQVSAKFPDHLVLGASGIVTVDREVPMGSPGTKFKIPFWKRITTFGDMAEGTPLTPNKVQADAEFAIVQRAGIALEVYDTASLVSKADPMTEIATQIARRAAEHMDARLVLQADNTPNKYDFSGTGTLTQDAIITGLVNNLGDNYAEVIGGGVLIMHSKVYGDLLKLGAIQNQYQSGMNVMQTGMIPTLLGMPIILSDRVTTSVVSTVTHYQTYVMAAASLGLFYQRDILVEFDRDILLQADIIAATVHFAPHLYGYDQDSSAVKAEDNKSIRVVAIEST